MPSIETTDYVLGIDLGSNSVGWAMIGLIDESHFIREFKRAWGVTPKVYRQGITSNRGGGAVKKADK